MFVLFFLFYFNFLFVYFYILFKFYFWVLLINFLKIGNSLRLSFRGFIGMLDFEGVIRLYGGDLKKVLESVVLERNNFVCYFFCK